MIVGFGVDCCAVSRLARRRDDSHFFCRVFTEEELRYAGSGADRAFHLAACWAAREAFAKATGIGLARLGFQGVALRREGGRPRIVPLSEAALRALEGRRCHLSITHEAELAFAAVLIEEV